MSEQVTAHWLHFRRRHRVFIYPLCPALNHMLHYQKLGKHNRELPCLHIEKLAEVDENVLQKLIDDFVRLVRKHNNVK